MATWGEVQGWSEVTRLNRQTKDVEKIYRYVVVTAKGNRFTEDVPEKVARSPELEAVLKAKAVELDKLVGK